MDTRTLVRIALVAALIGALGLAPPVFLPIAAGVPVTAQTLGVMLAGLLLGGRNGALAMALFVFVVLLGAPLLSGGRGGLGVLFGPSAGYLLGYIPGAYVTGALYPRLAGSRFLAAVLAAAAGGILVVHLCGIPVLAVAGGLGLAKAAIASAVFLPGDLVKAICAALLVTTVLRAWRADAPSAR